MIWLRLLPYAGWPLAAILFGLWLSARDAVIEERESCNADKLSSTLEAERIAFDAERKSLEQRLEDMASAAEREREGARIANEARETAEARPERVRTIVREVASAEKCVDTAMPSDILDELRD